MISTLTTSVTIEDAWGALPEHTRNEFLARRATATKWGAHGCQTNDSRRWEPLRPLVLQAAAYRHLETVVARLLTLAVESCQRRASTLGELHRILRFHVDLPLMDPDRALVAEELVRYARPDLLIERGQLRLLEFNNSTRLGGGTVTPRLSDAFTQVCPDAGLYSPPSVVNAHSAALVRSLNGRVGPGEPRRILIPNYWSLDESGQPRRHENVKRNVINNAQRAGFEVTRADLSELRLTAENRVVAGDAPIDLVLIHWGSTEAARIVNDGGGLDVVRTADRAGTVTVFPRTESALISSKVVLAWMHEDCATGQLSPADEDLVRSYVPWTVATGRSPARFANGTDLAIERRNQMIFKPASGKSGRGVIFGSQTSEQDWRVTAAGNSIDGPGVLQQVVQPDHLDMAFLDQDTKRRVDASVPFVLSPFMIDGAASSIGVRHLGPDAPNRDVVISVSRGGRSNAVVLTDSHPDTP